MAVTNMVSRALTAIVSVQAVGDNEQGVQLRVAVINPGRRPVSESREPT
jgi:hypothetical protein